MASKQVAVTSDLSGQLWNVCIWDLLTGTTLTTYKGGGGVCNPRTLTAVSDEYLVWSQKDTPIISVWSLLQKERLHLKIIAPGRVTALTVTSDATYCLVGVSEKLYIWQMSTGSLVAVLERHYQPITCIKSSKDGAYFVTGGEDGLALVWFLPDILRASDQSLLSNITTDTAGHAEEAKHVWTGHSGRVSDIHVGYGGAAARCATCSLDQTCRIYDLHSGAHLVTLVFNTPLWSVTMDAAEYFLFVGGEDGHVYETKLYEKPSHLMSRSEEPEPAFVGHTGKVSCLSVSIDGLALLSGSYDNTVKIWHLISKQCMRTVPHKGPISNAFIIPTPCGLLGDKTKASSITIKSFKRNADSSFGSFNDKGCVDIKIGNNESDLLNGKKRSQPPLGTTSSYKDEEGVETLKEEIESLKRINEQMYNYSADAIFRVMQ